MFQPMARCDKCGAIDTCPEMGRLPKVEISTRSGWYAVECPDGEKRLACSHVCFLAIATAEHEKQSKRLAKLQAGRDDNVSRFRKAVKSDAA